MLKKPENKTRKRLRITQCVLFLAEILFCTFTFVQIPNPDSTKLGFYATVFDMLGYLGGQFPEGDRVVPRDDPVYGVGDDFGVLFRPTDAEPKHGAARRDGKEKEGGEYGDRSFAFDGKQGGGEQGERRRDGARERAVEKLVAEQIDFFRFFRHVSSFGFNGNAPISRSFRFLRLN